VAMLILASASGVILPSKNAYSSNDDGPAIGGSPS
jgi:hypothetical protein